MNSYLLTLVLKGDLEEKDRKELLDEVEKKWKVEGGKWKVDLWGGRDLAYPIKKQTKGYYVHLEFETHPNVIKDLDKSLTVEENILRFLLVRV